MKNHILFGFLVFSLMGLLAPSIMTDSFADTDNNGRDQGKKTANGCEKGTSKNNPNCDDGGTEPPTDPLQFTYCDNNPIDGEITALELQYHVNNDPNSTIGISLSLAQFWIDSVSRDGDANINTDTELRKINSIIDEYNVTACT